MASVKRLELEWDLEILQRAFFYGYVWASAKQARAIRLLKGMHCSRPGELLRLFFARDVLVVKEIRWESLSVAAIGLAQRKWLAQSRTRVEEFCWP